MPHSDGSGISPQAQRLAAYVSAALDTPLPPEVALKTRCHILDTFAAIVSGSRLKVGRLATAFAEAQGGKPEATLIGTAQRVPAVVAALANGMSAHADETDDSHLRGRFHPGCGILPAAFAAGEACGSSGEDLIRAVALGYDVGARAVMSLGFARPDTALHSSHSLGPLFGATAAAAALYRLGPAQVRHAFSYAAQQASGIPFWQRDSEHVEKAFDFGGMGARNGMTAVALVAAGFTAVDDPFSGRHSLFTAFAENPDPEVLVADLGTRFEIIDASIKKWCVGSPIQSVLDAVTALIAAHDIRPQEIAGVTITVPDDRIHIIDNRTMPAVCAQHLAALALSDGTVTFESTHDESRMSDPAVLAMRSKIRLLPSAELTAARPARQAIVEIERIGKETVRHHAKAVRGTPDNPMAVPEIVAKVEDLISPVMGKARTEALIAAVLALDTLGTVRDLGPLLSLQDSGQ
ncbi:MmgE/PrpD family protein [Aquamicrobium soli]|uniref:MmgE/PrpD family protein n=1 Tax=Aquamicrobium soli TaxID=1811518 RepID=A0ABV7KAA0_9HYPH